ETIRRELRQNELSQVTLLQQPAHALEGVTERSCDTVVLNSVVQYFPDADYLRRVLRRASELVSDGGHIFVGDVRSLAHLEAFHTLIELHQAPAHLTAAELAGRAQRRVANDGELVLAPAFFEALTRDLPRVSGVDIRIKTALAHNEMSCFRYDVVLHIGKPALELVPEAQRVRPVPGPDNLADIAALLASEPSLLLLADLKNARLAPARNIESRLRSDTQATAETLRADLSAAQREGVDPGLLATLSAAYDVELTWAASGDPGRFDALFRHKQRAPHGRWPFAASSGSAASQHANSPARVSDDDTLVNSLRSHLREFLPEFMVPTSFVVMDALPLTPNGKIDRKALPDPQRKVRRGSAEDMAPPSNDLERVISEVWQQLLNVERVGRRENLFDLGANSLLTVQANNRLSTLLKRKISLVSMFRFPTVAALATHLGEANEGATAQAASKRGQERDERKKDAATRRRELRQERGSR
ncbi:MAG: hypothetical protein RL701_484, partial [Pseudomonadota bacterium]